MTNETLQMSAAGLALLRRREGMILSYYNDVANNCTFGIGTLVHVGPCTLEELNRPVTVDQVNIQLSTRVRAAEAAVKRRVRNTELTQAQFDSLVSFTFNVGATGARRVLDAANTGNAQGVVRRMSDTVYVRPRDAAGRPLQPIRVPGLVNRRAEEAAAFRR
jgi:lysozyme